MQAAINGSGLTIINFGIGSADAAMIMDLLIDGSEQAKQSWSLGSLNRWVKVLIGKP